MRVDQQVRPPHRALAGAISGLVAYRHAGLPQGPHRGAPSLQLQLVVPVTAPVVLLPTVEGRPGQAYDALLGGLRTVPVLVERGGVQEGVQVSLTPFGARALLGVPAAALAGADVELVDVLGAFAYELSDSVRAAPDLPTRLTVVERMLLRRIDTDAALPPQLAEALRLTAGSAAARLTVEGLAQRVGWSVRQLHHRFRSEVGMSPVQALRVARFDRTRRLLTQHVAAGQSPSLAVVAAAAGFFDQSHLTREWKALTGLSPVAWVDAELRHTGTGP